jgi:hypothetical protein
LAGFKTAADAFTPSGTLLKAALINSAVPMLRYVTASGGRLRLGLPPDNYQVCEDLTSCLLGLQLSTKHQRADLPPTYHSHCSVPY